ncbi:hypothetical protein FOXYSP1_10490 [Fusarium oxysporum f. sp. phaseoli]
MVTGKACSVQPREDLCSGNQMASNSASSRQRSYASEGRQSLGRERSRPPLENHPWWKLMPHSLGPWGFLMDKRSLLHCIWNRPWWTPSISSLLRQRTRRSSSFMPASWSLV